MSKDRLSSIELLRIIAILGVLLCHVGMVSGMLPTSGEIGRNPSASIINIFYLSLSIGSVDVFVLISGWFGIKATKRGLARFLYQVFFLIWIILIFFAIYSPQAINSSTLKGSFCIYDGYWFIVAYLGLYLLSPILNAFCEKATRTQFQFLLISLYAFQCYFTWLTGYIDYYKGYGITFFCILYLTARYIRLYNVKLIQDHGGAIFSAITIAITIITALGLRYTGTALRMLRYDNPMVIISSLGVLMFFLKWQFKSKIVNRLAMSVFAVYIIHFNPFVFPYFKKGVLAIYNSTSGAFTTLFIFLYLCLVFLICYVIDQLRVISWNRITSHFQCH